MICPTIANRLGFAATCVAVVALTDLALFADTEIYLVGRDVRIGIAADASGTAFDATDGTIYFSAGRSIFGFGAAAGTVREVVGGLSQPGSLALAESTKQLFVAARDGHHIDVLDLATRSIARTISTDKVTGLVYEPMRSELYGVGGRRLTVLDANTGRVQASLDWPSAVWSPVPFAAGDGQMFVRVDDRLLRLDPETHQVKETWAIRDRASTAALA